MTKGLPELTKCNVDNERTEFFEQNVDLDEG